MIMKILVAIIAIPWFLIALGFMWLWHFVIERRISHADFPVLAGDVAANSIFDVGGVASGCSRVL